MEEAPEDVEAAPWTWQLCALGWNCLQPVDLDLGIIISHCSIVLEININKMQGEEQFV